MKACFIGHRNILKSEELNNSLKETYQKNRRISRLSAVLLILLGLNLL